MKSARRGATIRSAASPASTRGRVRKPQRDLQRAEDGPQDAEDAARCGRSPGS